MATVSEHNNLLKICFDGNKHLRHILTDEHIKSMTLIEERFPLSKLPVCGHCEKLAMWKGKKGVCRSCGTITTNPVTYSTYLSQGYDVDATGATAKNVLKTRDEIVKTILPWEVNG